MSSNTERVRSGTRASAGRAPLHGLDPDTQVYQVAQYFWKLARLPDDTLRWKFPAEVARLLGLKANTVGKICRRLANPERVPHPLLVRRNGMYAWYRLPHWDTLKRVEAFFDPQRELLVHNLRAEGIIPGLYQIISKVENGAWHKRPWLTSEKLVRVYPLPERTQVTITVLSTDTVDVRVSPIHDRPWNLDEYCDFHARLNGILQELTGLPLLFDEFIFIQLHINQDFFEWTTEGPYVKLKLFRDTALAIYNKGYVRREYQVEGKPGIPAKHVKRLRHCTHEDNISLLRQKAGELEVMNVAVGISNAATQHFNLLKGHQRTILHHQDRLEKAVTNFSKGTFKDEILARLNFLGDEFHDLGSGVVQLTEAVTHRAQEDRTILQHLYNHQYEFEENITDKLDGIKEQQTHSLRLLNKLHHNMRTQGRGRKTREKIITTLDASQPITVKQIAEITGLSKSTIYSQLRTLVTLNVVEKIEGWPASYRLNQGGNV